MLEIWMLINLSNWSSHSILIGFIRLFSFHRFFHDFLKIVEIHPKNLILQHYKRRELEVFVNVWIFAPKLNIIYRFNFGAKIQIFEKLTRYKFGKVEIQMRFFWRFSSFRFWPARLNFLWCVDDDDWVQPCMSYFHACFCVTIVGVAVEKAQQTQLNPFTKLL